MGDPIAQYLLGTMYVQGRDVPQSDEDAAKWYAKAADQGLAAAQYNLCVLYYECLGIVCSTMDAAWWRKAAKQGYTEARVNLARIGQIIH